jgi:hypothetical protein
VNRFSDRRISDLANILHGFADLINTVDCGFIKYFGSDCGFRLQFSSDPGLLLHSIAFSGFKFRQDHCRIADFASNLGRSTDLYTPIHPPPPL